MIPRVKPEGMLFRKTGIHPRIKSESKLFGIML
jgi:hypothetical protein